jgi:hypothetical protein
MTAISDRLYKLLPPVYRERDAEQGYPLQQLLQVIEEQANVLQDDIAQLYANWFIETCQDWVVPYIGDLIGHKPVRNMNPNSSAGVLVQRKDVANTIEYRRRKGTLGLLAEMATSVTGWPARVVEIASRVGVTQALNHLRLERGRLIDLHDSETLDLLGSPFDRSGHTIDVRGIDCSQSAGLFNIANVALYLWRLRVYSVTRCRAHRVEQQGAHFYTFSALGNDVALYHKAAAPGKGTEIPTELDVPGPIRRRALARHHDEEDKPGVSTRYYGEGRSVAIWAGSWGDCDPSKPIPASKIISADLSGWGDWPPHGFVAVDPELGRIAFPLSQPPEQSVEVFYYYAFSADIGGGEYVRPVLMLPLSRLYCVGRDAEFADLRSAYRQWHKDQPARAVIQIQDSRMYLEQVRFELDRNQYVELRAANGARPVISLPDHQGNDPDAFVIEGRPGSTFVLDGILVTGRGLELRDQLRQVTIRNSSLIPGWSLHSDCEPHRRGEPSLALMDCSAAITIQSSITGPISVRYGRERKTGPNLLRISDSIVDACHHDGAAIFSPGEAVAPFSLTLQRSTVLGRIETHSIELVENSIITGTLTVARRQHGCVRFSYIPRGSRTPQRYFCQPDLADRRIQALLHGEPLVDSNAVQAEERLSVQPQFESTRYGLPGYCRLIEDSSNELKTGADDQSEMGVFHQLYEPQLETNLRIRLEEFSPAGIEVGVIHAN